ncbi:unnamed protein product [Caenorhabditis auriculariae]|uniref:CRAL-TRIO domain-containing protein n=1 Tax=Caenorhabditis auriculariae TaxID=2777116 RepID=A0A8S1H9W3_9PELO|nr:unnamed protein product [Caenorhabditis auriculariae]
MRFGRCTRVVEQAKTVFGSRESVAKENSFKQRRAGTANWLPIGNNFSFLLLDTSPFPFLIRLFFLQSVKSTNEFSVDDSDDFISPGQFSDELLSKAHKMRKSLDISENIDSPFFVARFLRANNGDEEKSRQRIRDFLTHRKVLGYDKASDLDIFTKVPIGKQCFERFRISMLDYTTRSKDVHVFVQKMEGTDLKEIMKVMPASYVIHSYYMLQENFGRVVAATEKETGRPSSVVCILDLKGLNLSEFINPLSGPAQVARLVVKVWSDYFSENLCKLLVVNSPGIISFMWTITKHIMDAQTAEKLVFLGSTEELKKYLEIKSIPMEYGGEWQDKSGFADTPGDCCRSPKSIEKSHYRSPEVVWTENHVSKVPSSQSFSLKSHQSVEVVRKAASKGRLVWSFTVSGDVEFEVVKRASDQETHVWPMITLTSLKLPEFGAISVEGGGTEYVLRFTNPTSTWFPVKINLAADVFS